MQATSCAMIKKEYSGKKMLAENKASMHVLNVGGVCVNKVKEGVGVLTNK